MNRMLALILMLAFAPAGTAFARQSANKEAVQVHGDWTLEVVRPDGSVAERRSFANAFTGADGVRDVLLGAKSAGFWYISLAPATPNAPWPGAGQWALTPADAVGLAGSATRNLTIQAVGGSLELSGSLTATRDGAIGGVNTWLTLCPASTLAAQCRQQPDTDETHFSGTTLYNSQGAAQPLQLLADQLLRVKVMISFTAVPHVTPPSE